jgi:MOSC domain-containing protein YiiM
MEEKIEGKIESINVSSKKGGKKSPIKNAFFNKAGIDGDGHSGDWHRQVSLLSAGSIQKVIDEGIEVKPGDFAENLTVSGLELTKLEVGDRLEIRGSGNKEEVILEVTQIGKECPKPCSIYYQMGSCIMPKEGIFCRVIRTGNIKVGDKILIGESR